MSVSAGGRPDLHPRDRDVRGAVVDILISKTFDSSDLPGQQTCIIDEAIYDAMVAEFQRMGARLLSDDDEVAALSAAAFDNGAVQLQTVGQSRA